MKIRTLNIDCDAATARRLAEAIRGYTHAAYPHGGSECAQVARQALLDAAATCESHVAGSLILRKRQLPVLRAAVRWWLGEAGPGDLASGPDLEAILATDNRRAR